MKKGLSLFLALLLMLSTSVFSASATEDITGDVTEFALNNTTVDLSNGDAANSTASYATLQKNQYFEYTVSTEQEGDYVLIFTCGTESAAVSLDISVNGTLVLDNAPLANTGAFNKRNPHTLGIIHLSIGDNTIRFKTNGGAVVSKRFSLTKVVDDITGDTTEFALNNTTVDLSNGDAANSTASYATLQKNQYFEYTVSTMQEGDYLLIFTCGTDRATTSLDISVNGTLVLDNAPLANTGAFNKRNPHTLGIIHLSIGDNTIRFMTNGGAVVAKWFSLTKVVEDITSNPMTFALNTSTINTSASKIESNSGTGYVVLSPGGYAEYTVNTTKAASYLISASAGTTKDGVCLSVAVNGTTLPESTTIPNTGSYTTRPDHILGVVTLAQGPNKIKISSVSTTSSEWTVIKSFTLWDAENATPISSSAATRLEIENYATENVKDKACASGGKWVSDTWVESVSPIYMILDVENDGYYDLDYTMMHRGSKEYLSTITIYIDGKSVGNNTGTYIENLDSEGGFSWAHASFCKYRKEQLWLEKGHHTVKIDIGITSDNVYKYQMDYLEFAPCMGFDIKKLQVVTEEGARLPYDIEDGATAYAKAEIIKFSEVDDVLQLIFAQYDDNKQLVQTDKKEIDISAMTVFATETFMVPLTFCGSGGVVKAFLWDNTTCAPLVEEVTYSEQYFFDDSVLYETASYTDATNVLNMDGEYYADYSIHDENYDIDAIFYDSVVGEQSKVFAFVGIPKGASEEKPVPAVVCIHGGGGYAFSKWVKHWNDRGYAAIAMSLTGDGPDKVAPEVMYTTHPHPYKGVYCWDDKTFSADYKNAGMYQNVLNVIRAHNVIRSYPGVDETKTGIIGVSWGGVTATTVIGVDNRFTFAIPVYGAGYLDESETSFRNHFTKDTNTVRWDPANFAALSTVPTLYINGDSDTYFSINSTTKTARATENSKICIRHNFEHGHSPVYKLEQVYNYADAMTQGYDPFITISDETVEGNVLTAKIDYPDGVSVASVTTYYIKTAELAYGGKIDWKSTTAYEITEDGISVAIPSGATFCYTAVTDNNGNVIATEYLPVK